MADQPDDSIDQSQVPRKQSVDDQQAAQGRVASGSTEDSTDNVADLPPNGEKLTGASPEPKKGKKPKSKNKKKSFSGSPAIIAGVFGVVGALAGGVATGTVSYITANRQISSASNQSSVQFYRQQKQTLYAQLLQDSINAGQPIANYGHEFARTADPGSADFIKLKDATYTWTAKISEDYNTIRLIGGSAVIDSAKDLWTKRSAQVRVVDQLYSRWANHTLSEFDRRTSYVDWPPQARAAMQAEDSFANTARWDLQSTR
jgi:hypothetical protein